VEILDTTGQNAGNPEKKWFFFSLPISLLCTGFSRVGLGEHVVCQRCSTPVVPGSLPRAAERVETVPRAEVAGVAAFRWPPLGAALV